MDILDQAIVFATHAHAGMVRKGTNNPYILHPLEAAAIVGTMTTDREVIAAAVLHDVVEDTNHSVEEIEEKFGARIAGLVAAESENKREDLPAEDTWKIRKQETLNHLNSVTDIGVKMIALGDKLSNIRSIYRDKLVLGNGLWDRFNQKDPQEHYWYYNGICEALSELSDYPAWQEYSELIAKVFTQDSAGEDQENPAKEPWAYCAVGNIKKTHQAPDGTILYGTIAYSGGTKVFLAGKYWYPGNEYITVIGLNRFKRFEVSHVPVELIENVRLQRIYKASVLCLMEDWEFHDDWWKNTKKDKKSARAFLDRWNTTMHSRTEEK